MEIRCTNLVGATQATIETAKITGIFGRNGAGKTSLLRYIAAACTGKVIPIDSVRKSDGMLFVAQEALTGEVTIEYPTGTTTVKYPEAQKTIDGAPLMVSDYAAGIDSFLDKTTKERSEVICALLKTLPTRADLVDALSSLKLPDAAVERLWQTIESQGWEQAHAGVKEKGIKLKGQWEGETGERYGSDKAAQWKPSDWVPMLDQSTEASLREDLKHEQEWLEAAISSSAVSAAEVSRLNELAKQIPAIKAEIEASNVTVAALKKNEKDLQEALNKVPTTMQAPSASCPHCKKPVMISSGKLVIPEIIPKEELDKRAKALEECVESLRAVRAELDKVQKSVSGTWAKLESAEAAGKKLASQTSATRAPAMGQKSVEDCRAMVSRAEYRLQLFVRREKSRSLAVQIAGNKVVVDALAPDGLRLKKLSESLVRLNGTLSELSRIAGWPVTEICDNMAVSYGGEMFSLKSKSEQFRATVALQVAFAMFDASEYVMIDGIDVLDGPGRNGLFKMLLSVGMNSIVTCTVDRVEQVPALEKVGGLAYWVENGRTSTVGGTNESKN